MNHSSAASIRIYIEKHVDIIEPLLLVHIENLSLDQIKRMCVINRSLIQLRTENYVSFALRIRCPFERVSTLLFLQRFY